MRPTILDSPSLSAPRASLCLLGICTLLVLPATALVAQDLTATKTNNVSGNALIDDPFTWTIVVENIGATAYSLISSFPFLVDDLPVRGAGASRVEEGLHRGRR